jgi:hypothetical protein
MAIDIGKREFIYALGGAAVAWPLAARAQQPMMPVVGFLSILSSSYIASRMPSVRQGLKEAGYIEGQNVAIEYRLADGHHDRLPDLAADLVGRRVAAIVTAGIDPTKVAKAATATLPIVFLSDVDPVNAGVVKSRIIARPPCSLRARSRGDPEGGARAIPAGGIRNPAPGRLWASIDRHYDRSARSSLHWRGEGPPVCTR